MNKVYCKYCTHASWSEPIDCLHPSNKMIVDTPAEEKQILKDVIEKLNAKNNCKNYKKSFF